MNSIIRNRIHYLFTLYLLTGGMFVSGHLLVFHILVLLVTMLYWLTAKQGFLTRIDYTGIENGYIRHLYNCIGIDITGYDTIASWGPMILLLIYDLRKFYQV